MSRNAGVSFVDDKRMFVLPSPFQVRVTDWVG